MSVLELRKGSRDYYATSATFLKLSWENSLGISSSCSLRTAFGAGFSVVLLSTSESSRGRKKALFGGEMASLLLYTQAGVDSVYTVVNGNQWFHQPVRWKESSH